MSIGDGTHFKGPLLGDSSVGGGLYADVPIQAIATRRYHFFFYDFIDQNDEASLTVTAIGGGTAGIQPNAGSGILYLSAGGIANQGLSSVQYTEGAGAYLEPPTVNEENVLPISFCTRVKLSEWANSDWYVGLAFTDPALMGANGTLGVQGGGHQVGFHHLVADGNDVRLTAESSALGVNPPVMLSQAQVPKTFTNHLPAYPYHENHEFGIRITHSNRVSFYLDGVYRHTTTLSTEYTGAWVPSYALISNGADPTTLEVDYYWTSARRGRDSIST